nr:immunoglobulin heavy chain junction region [Mus musculus]MBK4197881.1 immunoglobulin heavy chain junction region [Mus musculus]
CARGKYSNPFAYW